jgi:hypothetical protein
MLKLSHSFAWIKVIAHGSVPTTRYTHASTYIDSKLIIFGGLNAKTYSRGFLSICELNKILAKNKLFEEEVNKKDDKFKGKRRRSNLGIALSPE